MRERVHVWPEEILCTDKSLTSGARVEMPDGNHWRLWYRLPAAHAASVTRSADPFLLGVLFSAMQTPADVHVHGTISPSLLRNLEEFQAAWALWKPEHYRQVDCTADTEQEQPRAPGDEAILGFSGGVDSTFSAWRRRPAEAGKHQPKLAAGVMVHGFDIPLDDTEAFESAAEKNRRMLASIGVDLIPIATNLREQHNDWDDLHGAALAACLAILQGGYGTGFIASSYIYSKLILPYGSNPVTDWMLSSDSFQVVHDGAAHHKAEKVREITQWPEAMQYLRVCWEGRLKDRNCCRCQKCVWTLLTLRAMGQGLPACFPHDISDGELRRLKFHDVASLDSTRRFIAWLKAEGISASWVRALQVSVVANQLRFAVMGRVPFPKPLRRLARLWFVSPQAP